MQETDAVRLVTLRLVLVGCVALLFGAGVIYSPESRSSLVALFSVVGVVATAAASESRRPRK